MKKMIISVLVLGFALTAKAGNEGPQAAPPVPPVILAERTTNGGFFVPPDSAYAISLQILSNGDVQKVEFYRDPTVNKVNVILTLKAAQVSKLSKLVNQVQEGKMIDPNPQAPGCQDGPMFTDAVYHGNTRIEISQNVACKSLVHENANKADAQVIKVLNAVERLIQARK